MVHHCDPLVGKDRAFISESLVLMKNPRIVFFTLRASSFSLFSQLDQNFKIVLPINCLTLWYPFNHDHALDIEKKTIKIAFIFDLHFFVFFIFGVRSFPVLFVSESYWKWYILSHVMIFPSKSDSNFFLLPTWDFWEPFWLKLRPYLTDHVKFVVQFLY